MTGSDEVHAHPVDVDQSFMQIDVSFMRDGSLVRLEGAKPPALIAAGQH